MTHGEFGPQGDAADRFLEALDRLDMPETVALGAAGGGVVGTDALDPQVIARAELRLELREIARRAGRLDAVRAIGREVERWAGSAQHWFPAGVAGTSELAASLGPRLAALPVVLDAAYGVVLADQLREAELVLLLGPWRDLAGDPFDPGDPFGPGAQDEARDADDADGRDDGAGEPGAEDQPD
ncbi:MAG TPA: hypothetical protein VIK16_00015 [Candidatus Limnocylindrales bacterium]